MDLVKKKYIRLRKYTRKDGSVTIYEYDWRSHHPDYDDNLVSKKKIIKTDSTICKDYINNMSDEDAHRLKKYIEKKIYPKHRRNKILQKK